MISLTKNNIKTITCALLVGIILGSTVMIAYAATTYSSEKPYGPGYGYSYKNRAIAYSDGSGYCEARTSVRTADPDITIPTGYMGAVPIMWSDSDQLIAYGQWVYNGNEVHALLAVIEQYPSEAIYSHGLTKAYNGNSYNEYSTYQSPNVNP